MLDISALEAAFARIGEIGKGEVDVEFDGVRVVLRALLPEEDVEVQKYARGDAEGGTENLLLIERYKRATIAYAVVQVGGLNLRGVTTIPTGEVLENGVPVKVPKVVAVRRIVETWSRQATSLVFQRYAELIRRIEDEANSKVQFDKSNVDAEIERLESRLVELRRVKAGEQLPKGITTEIIDQADKESRGYAVVPPSKTSDDRPSEVSEPVASTPVASAPTAPAPPRTRVMPQTVAPPSPNRVEQAPQTTHEDTLPNVLNSFGDATDDSIAAETARILEARNRAAASVAQSASTDDGIPNPIPVRTGRVPPHMGAARVAAEVPVIDPLSSAESVEPVGNVPTFRLPSSNITDRGRRPSNAPPPPTGRGQGLGQRATQTPVNNVPSGNPNNPNFRGGGGR